jgi:hypothetical protein
MRPVRASPCRAKSTSGYAVRAAPLKLFTDASVRRAVCYCSPETVPLEHQQIVRSSRLVRVELAVAGTSRIGNIVDGLVDVRFDLPPEKVVCTDGSICADDVSYACQALDGLHRHLVLLVISDRRKRRAVRSRAERGAGGKGVSGGPVRHQPHLRPVVTRQ